MRRNYHENHPHGSGAGSCRPVQPGHRGKRRTLLLGQIAINLAEGKIVATTIEEQAEQCCRNVEAVLKEAGTDMSHVVKTTCFLAEIADFKAFNEVYAKHFVSKPARSCVAVKDLPAGALCEVEVTAVL